MCDDNVKDVNVLFFVYIKVLDLVHDLIANICISVCQMILFMERWTNQTLHKKQPAHFHT